MNKRNSAVLKLLISVFFLLTVFEPVKATAVSVDSAEAILVLHVSDVSAFDACERLDRSLGSIPQIGIVRLAIPEALADQRIAHYLACPAVTQAYLEQRSVISMTPIDPGYASGQWNLQQLGMEAVWDITTGSSDVIVAVIDTGVDIDWGLANFDPEHFVLGASFLTDFSNVSFIQEDRYLGQYSYDGGSHGTAVASVIGAAMDDQAITGIAPGVKIMPIKVFTDELIGDDAYANNSDIAAAIVWATDHGADIINMSFGGPHDSAIHEAVIYADQHGVILVAASGNESNHFGIGGTVEHMYQSSPALYREVIGVGSITALDQVSNFSDVGERSSDPLDVVTYGEGLYLPWNATGQYELLDGTSFSAPTVAAVLALMLSVNPNLTPEQARSILISTANDLTGPLLSTHYDNYTGFGKLDPLEAVNVAKAYDASFQDANHDVESAVVVRAGETVSESISYFGDADYFTFALYDRVGIKLQVTPGGSEDLALVLLDSNGKEITSRDFFYNGVGEILTEYLDPGVYTARVVDANSAFSAATYTATLTLQSVVKSAITASTKEGNLLNQATAYSDVTLQVKSTYRYEMSVSKDGEPYAIPDGLVFTEPGLYQVSVDDTANDPITFTFTIKDAVTIDGVIDGRYYATPRTIHFSSGEATLNGQPFESGQTVDVDGTYTLVVTSGSNVETLTFTLDMTAPITNVKEGDRFYDSVIISFNEGTALLDGVKITNNTTVNTGSVHQLVITDLAGNVTTVNFNILTSPGFKQPQVTSTQTTVTFTFDTNTFDKIEVFMATVSHGPSTLVSTLVGTTQAVITGLNPYTNYYFTFKTTLTLDGVTRSTTSYDIYVQTLSDVVLLDAPSYLKVTPYNNFTARIEWPAVSGAEGYELWHMGYWKDTLLLSSPTATSFTVTNLNPNTLYNQYDFQVRYYKTINGVKTYSAYAHQRIIYELTPPQNVTAVSKSLTTMDVTWTAITGAVNYTVQYYDRVNNVFKTVTVTTNKVTLTGLTPFVGYNIYVNVKMVNNSTYYISKYSNELIVHTALPSPVLKGTINGISSLTVSWPAVTDAMGYSLYYLDEETGNYEFAADTLLTSLSLSNLTMGKTYSFKVKAFSVFLGVRYYSLNSNTVSLTPAPVAITGLKALDLRIGSVKFGWTPMDGAEGYEVCQATTSTGTCVSVGMTTDTSFEKTGLAFNTTYYYKVRAYLTYNGTRVYGAYSAPAAFKTAVPAVTNLVASSAGYNANLLSWTPVSGASGYEVYVAVGSSTTYALVKTVTTASFTHTGLLTNTKYSYKVRAVRTVSTTKYTGVFSAIAASIPVPAKPVVTAISSDTDAITATWPAIAGATAYEIQWALSPDFTGATTVISTTAKFVQTGLTPNVPVYVKVRAYRLVSPTKVFGSWSDPVQVKPLPKTPILSGSVVDYRSIALAWSAVTRANGYELYRIDPLTQTDVLVQDSTALSYVETDLVTGSVHRFKVRAYVIIDGTRIYSTDSPLVVLSPIPSSVKGFTVKPAKYNQLTLTWSPVDGATGYEILRSTTATGTTVIVASVEGNTTFVDSGLTFNATYFYKLRPYTTVNDIKVYGNLTAVVSAKTTLETVLNPSARSLAYNANTLSWSPVDGASGYEVWRSTGTSTYYTLVRTQTTVGFVNTSLYTNTRYNYKIRAYRLVGSTKVYGAFSSIVSSIPLPAAPAPSAASAGYNALKISWPAVAGANGYEVSYATVETGPFTVRPTQTTTSTTLTGLLTNTTYTVRVRAYRIVNYKKIYGAYSNLITGTPIPSTPAPKVVSSGYDSLTVSWAAIAGANGYLVQWLNPSTQTYDPLIDTTALSAVHTGLVSGVAQSYRVFAYRLVGETKVVSTVSVTVTATPIPSVAAGLKLSATNVSTLDFIWSPVGGANGYEIARSTTATGVYTVLGTTETTTYRVSGLSFNATSYIRVRAYTVVGETKVYGNWTTAIAAKTLPGTPTLSLSSPSITSIQVNWAAVTGVSGYEIWRSNGTSTYYTLIKTQTTAGFLNTGLVFNTRYNYKVRAYKLVGTTKVYGSYSAITSHYTQVPAPTVLSGSTHDSITVNWAAVSGASGYEVAFASAETGPYTVALQTGLTKTFGGLTTGSTYYIKVRSYRLVSTTKVYGPYSPVLAVTPQLSVPTLSFTTVSDTSVTVAWDAVPGATDYEIRIRQDIPDAPWIIEEVSELSVSFNDLTPAATYIAEIRAINKTNDVAVYSPYSTTTPFTTLSSS